MSHKAWESLQPQPPNQLGGRWKRPSVAPALQFPQAPFIPPASRRLTRLSRILTGSVSSTVYDSAPGSSNLLGELTAPSILGNRDAYIRGISLTVNTSSGAVSHSRASVMAVVGMTSVGDFLWQKGLGLTGDGTASATSFRGGAWSLEDTERIQVFVQNGASADRVLWALYYQTKPNGSPELQPYWDPPQPFYDVANVALFQTTGSVAAFANLTAFFTYEVVAMGHENNSTDGITGSLETNDGTASMQITTQASSTLSNLGTWSGGSRVVERQLSLLASSNLIPKFQYRITNAVGGVTTRAYIVTKGSPNS